MGRERKQVQTLEDLPIGTLHSDILIPIMIKTPIKSLLPFCKADKRIHDICKDESFWVAKLRNDYPKEAILLKQVSIPLNKDTYKALYSLRGRSLVNIAEYYIGINNDHYLAKEPPIVVDYILRLKKRDLRAPIAAPWGNIYFTDLAMGNGNYPLFKWLVERGVPVQESVREKIDDLLNDDYERKRIDVGAFLAMKKLLKNMK